MKQVLLIGGLVLAAVLVARALHVATASDETRIEWLFAAEAEAFNSASALSTLDHFALEYRDDTRGLDRQALRGAVLWTFQNKRDAQRRFLCRVELPERAGAITVDGDSATAVLPLRLYEGLDTDERLVWEMRVTAELSRIDGEWRIVRSTHETIRGGVSGR